MAEKLKRDRSLRIQSGSNSVRSENQSTIRRQYSSSREVNDDRREPSVRRRDTQNKKMGINYPPLEDYSE